MGELKTIGMQKSKARQEQLQRERAAEARRKKEIREKRRRMRQIRFFATWIIIIFTGLTAILLIVGGVTGAFEKDEPKTTVAQNQSEETFEVVFEPSGHTFTEDMYKFDNSVEVLEKLENLKASKSDMAEAIDFILENERAYPENLIKLVTKSPEAINFALEYPFKRGQDDTVAADISGDYTAGEIPLLLQWDERWGYVSYGDDIIALDGCGPTCLSMVTVGLTGNIKWTPVRVARMSMQNNYYFPEQGTAWALMYEGCEQMGLKAETVSLSEEEMIKHVQAGRPIIASMAPGDFTDVGHFIVIVDYKDEMFYVNDPNSRKNSSTGWTYERLKGQIKNMWAYSLAE